MCYKNGSNLVVDSMRLPDKMKMGLNGGLVNGTRSMGILYKDNRIICKYRRTFTVPAESEQYMRSLEAPKFAVWGNSEALTGNGEPGQHMGPGSNERFAEEMQTDLRFVAVSFFTLICLPAFEELKNQFVAAVCYSMLSSFFLFLSQTNKIK